MDSTARRPILASLCTLLAVACVHETKPRQLGSIGKGPAIAAEPESEKSPWESCYSTFSPSGEPTADLARLTQSCGPTGGMAAITEVQSGQQHEADPADRYTFPVPEGGKCYRVYATAETNVADLTVSIRDPKGADVAADLTNRSWPVLPPGEPVCVEEPGLYQLEVSVQRGSGRYALQVWGR